MIAQSSSAGILLCLLFTGGAAAQDFTDYHVEKVVTGFHYLNSPVFAREGFLLLTDPPANKVLKWTTGKPDVLLENSAGASGLGMDTSARIYVCESRARRIVRIDKNRKLEVVADSWEGKKFNAPNDIIVRRDGHAYFTDPAFGYQQDTKELDFYGVFHLSPKGEVTPIAKWSTRPNGIGMNFAGRILYVGDADRRAIRAFDIDKNGRATNERPFVSGIEGVPRGLTLDEKGNVYVAAKNVDVYSPEGKRIWRFEFGTEPSSCTFGDGDLQALFITAGESLYRIRLKVKGSVQH